MPIQVMTTIHAERTPGRTALLAMLLVLLGLILAVPSGPAAAQSAAGGDLTWQVVEVSGDVRVRTAASPPSPWRPLVVSHAVSAKAEIETGGDGRAVLAHEGSRITISSNSQLALPDHVPSGAIYRVAQRAGTMLFKIVHATKDKFQVETPYLTTVIKGTTFSVSVNGAGGSVHVTEGAVMVRPLSGEAALVTPGQTARVPAGSRGGVIINGRNGNGGGGNGRAAVPAVDKAEKVNAPDSSPGPLQAADKTPVAKPESAESDKAQDAGTSDAKQTAPRRSVAIIFETDKGKSANGDLKAKGESESARGQADAKTSGQSKDKSSSASSASDGRGNSGRDGASAGSTSAAATVVANSVDSATSSSGVASASNGTASAAAGSSGSGSGASAAAAAPAAAAGGVGVVANNAASSLGLSQSGNGNANGLGNGNGNSLGNGAAATATNTVGGALSGAAAVTSSVTISSSISTPTAASITIAPGNGTVAISGNANGLAGTTPASLGKSDNGNGNGNGLALGHSKKF